MLRKDDADEFKRVIFTREGTMILEIPPTPRMANRMTNITNQSVPDSLQIRCYFSRPFLVCGKNETDWN